MFRLMQCLIAVLILVLAFAVQAQNSAPSTAYVYVSYFQCDPAGEARADEIIARNFKPHYDAAVEGGNLVSWSWLAHFVGGEWRRAHVIAATNMDDLLDSSGALGEIIEETTPEAGRAFTEVCSRHIDYIWESVPGVGLGSGIVGGRRGGAGFSMYFTCDLSREERADELMSEVFAPAYNRQVESGGLVSWGWLKHNVGGPWRRLLTMTGAFREFSSICNSHEDYLWDIKLETP